MRAARLYLFAKEPRPGRVKTRLTPPLTSAQAAMCQKAFVVDLVNRVRRVPGFDPIIAACPYNAAPWLVSLAARSELGLVWQGRGDLGARMERQLCRAVREGRAGIILGADVPDLPLGVLREALEVLKRRGTVIGPAGDGGYYLIGCNGRVPPVFRLKAPWGATGVLEETLARLRSLGEPVHQLARWEDVDDYASLRRLASRIAATRRSYDGLARTAALLGTLVGGGSP
jgi:rSAM/selenodomain-associated transferase 1